MIYTFDTKGFLLYPVMKACFDLGEEDVYEIIQQGFELLQERLALKRISYDKLKGALIPNQDKDKFETCLVIDSAQIDASDYGYYVFKRLIPLLDRESTYSILCGDYIDILNRVKASQCYLRAAMNEVLARCHASEYVHSNQYYLIYFNRLSGNQRLKIVEGLNSYSWFTGLADLTHSSRFKTYLAAILPQVCIKHKNRVIAAHPSDYSDTEDINMRGFPFEENGFLFSSINDESYGPFLSYKIESEVPDEDDVGFSFNALFPKFDALSKININIADKRWSKYLTDKEKGKGRILESLGYLAGDKDRFVKEIFKQICANYIYNLRENPYGDLMFDVCIELPTKNSHLRKTTIALKYTPETGEAEVVTIT